MEKWMRGLSKTTTLIIGIVSLAVLAILGIYINSNVSGFIPIILLCALLGGGIGFAFPLLYKGISGQTPQERKQSQKG